MDNFSEGESMPLGLGLALSQNLKAMNRFASLTPEQKQQMIEHTHQISSSREMKAYVQQFADDKTSWS